MTQLTLQSNEGYTFLFQAVVPISNSKQQPSQKIPLPNAQAKDQLLFRFFGQNEDFSFDFALFPSSVDLSDGTAPGGDFPTGVKTVLEQHEFLMDFMYSANFARYWKFTAPTHRSVAIFGNIENMSFDQPKSSRDQYRTGRITFQRGKLAGVPEF